MKISSILGLALFCFALAPAAKAEDFQNQQYPQYQQNPQELQNQQNQQACMGDAVTLCGQFIPDRERVAACLLSNRNRVSMACRVALAHWHG